ncbi:hypothetical protein G6O67_003306 [Ophiocordyceps sinensis]|uniref:Tf2-1-like SH3-like domain-containing protein n=1 Tax=Ophiocordyceps sinensis TaxID=72228 RepID=A0A8H4V866_9HYPO|nr:hypothetical protein G6O67_003306 [Ophiocordyceps sinensis]
MEGVPQSIIDKPPCANVNGKLERRIGHDFARIGLPKPFGPMFETLREHLTGLFEAQSYGIQLSPASPSGELGRTHLVTRLVTPPSRAHLRADLPNRPPSTLSPRLVITRLAIRRTFLLGVRIQSRSRGLIRGLTRDLAAMRAKRRYDSKHRHVVFKAGDKVYLKLHSGYPEPTKLTKKWSRKWSRQRKGPFVIRRMVNDLAAELELSAQVLIHPVIFVEQLKPVIFVEQLKPVIFVEQLKPAHQGCFEEAKPGAIEAAQDIADAPE